MPFCPRAFFASLVLPCLSGVCVAETAVKPAAGQETALSELLRVQAQVQQRLESARAALVAVQIGPGGGDEHGGAASGVIISADGLLLTAAHVVDKPGRSFRVVLADGSVSTATSLGMDTQTDAALAQLKKREKPWPHVKLSREVSRALPGEWCFALGHPGGYERERGPVLRVGKIIKQTANSLHTDCVLMGGDSGGPLFNLAGELIGIHSLIWEERDQNVHVSMAPFLRSWDAMRASHVIKRWSTGAGGYLGVLTDDGSLEVLDVIEGSPAQAAGVRAGDVIVSLNAVPMTMQAQFKSAIKARAAGDTIVLRLKSGDKEREVTVKLGQQPSEGE